MNLNQSTDSAVIEATQAWIEQVVIRHQFCPFAAKPFQDKTIRYRTISQADLSDLSQLFLYESGLLDTKATPETTLLIFKNSLSDFHDYLDVLADCEEILEDHGYTGVYQLASFHPNYQFAGTTPEDVTNFTNRSPYPIIQLLREDSVSSALAKYPNPEKIPERNMDKARDVWGKG